MMQCRRRRRHFFNESRLQNEPATCLKILARVNVTAHAVNVNALIQTSVLLGPNLKKIFSL